MPDASISPVGAEVPLLPTAANKNQIPDEATIRKMLIELVAKYTGIPSVDISEKTAFKYSGLDSLDLAEMAEELDAVFNINLPNNVIDMKTVGELLKAINQELPDFKSE